MKNEKYFLKIKTDDVKKQCNLLFSRILAEKNIALKNCKDKSIILYGDGVRRLIELKYVKKPLNQNKEDIFNINISLLDNGEDSEFCSYYDDESKCIVHDARVVNVDLMYNGERMDFNEEDLIRINNNVLEDLRKPFNISDSNIVNEELLFDVSKRIVVDSKTLETQLQECTKEFVKSSKRRIPRIFKESKIEFVKDKNELYRGEFKKSPVKCLVYTRDFIDAVFEHEDGEIEKHIINQYVISLFANDGSELNIILSEENIVDVSSGKQVLTVTGIGALEGLEDGYKEFYDFSESEENELMSDFSKLNYIRFPKYISAS